MADNSVMKLFYLFKLFIQMRVKFDRNGFTLPKVRNSNQTIDTLCERSVSLSRISDGELDLIEGTKRDFQPHSEKLAKRLKEVLDSPADDNILICIPAVFHFRNYINLDYRSRFFWLHNFIKRDFSKLVINNKIYYDTNVTRLFICYRKSKREKIAKRLVTGFKQIWNGKDVILVEGKFTRVGYGNDLFDNAKSLKRITCPRIDAFDKYDEILKSAVEQGKDKLFLLSLGPTATILAYDLAKLGYRAIDIGNIDFEYECYIHGLNEKEENQRKHTLTYSEAKDSEYFSQIIIDLHDE